MTRHSWQQIHAAYIYRQCIALLLFLIFAAGSRPAQAAETIHVGYVPLADHMQAGPNNTYHGMLYGYMELLSSYADVNFKYYEGSESDCQKWLKDGTIDVIMNISVNELNDPSLVYNRYSVNKRLPYFVGYQPDGRYPLLVGKPSVLSEAEVIAELKKHDMQYGKDYVFTPTTAATSTQRKMYLEGELDGYVETMQSIVVAPNKIALTYSNGFITTLPEKQWILDKLDDAYERLEKDRPTIRSEVYNDSLDYTRPLVLSKEEKEYLKKKGTIQVLAAEGQKPYLSWENGQPEGFIPYIWELIGKDLGVKIEYINCETNAKQYLRFISGEGDAISGFNFDPNWAALQEAGMTVPFTNLEYVTVMRKWDNLPDKPIVAAVKGHQYTHQYIERKYPASQIIYFNSPRECMEAVSDGTADLTIEKDIVASYQINKGDFYNLYTNGISVFSHKLALAAHKNKDPLLLQILSKEVARFSPQMYLDIMHHYSAANASSPSFAAFLYTYPLRTGIAVLIFFGTIIALMWTIARKHRRDLLTQLHTNRDTGLKSTEWLEAQIPQYLERYAEEKKAGRIALFNVSFKNITALRGAYKISVYTQGFKELHRHLAEKYSWIVASSVNSDLSRLDLFVVLPPSMTPMQAAQRMARENTFITMAKNSIAIGLRIGVNPVEPDYNGIARRLLLRAHIANNEAQIHNEDIGIYSPQMQDHLTNEGNIENLMHQALAQDEFKVYLQPKYDIIAHKVCGAEALVRWHSKELGTMLPNSFISVMEKSGFIINLDYYMLEQILRLQHERKVHGLPIIPISVNQSGLHINEADYLSNLEQLAKKYHLVPGTVELEITETAFINFSNPTGTLKTSTLISEIKKLGFHISIDDFLKGYASLSMLQNIDVDVIKVDRDMLLEAEKDKRAYSILQYVLQLSHMIDAKIIIEGVETENQEQLVKALDVRYVQGWRYGKAMPLKEFLEYLAENI